MESIRIGHLAAAQMLLRCGASVNQAGPSGVTPLMLAAAHPDMESLVEMLLDYEADPAAVDGSGRTAIK